ncbi:Zn-dependent protease with chaperone function [Bacillus sp. RC240]|uniref:Uncharacterized protein n=1 Tax=Bacillus mycoides TaxID=1405 RepID=A0AAP8GXY1_BACMY|nr:hypothetical protein C174_06063 [Bacillus mycoides FSL H7-687]KMQ13138.1 hypothetical protein TU70_27310 [Bacillus mycoides]OOR54790.1 hypothetical protein BGP34_26480 [Bacillus mycoides]PJN58483.1 hypothetical protein BAWEI_49820 [Bacillus mycoides]PJN70753.1 hypothetical protein BACWE_24080 [Bacillus mycoides]
MNKKRKKILITLILFFITSIIFWLIATISINHSLILLLIIFTLTIYASINDWKKNHNDSILFIVASVFILLCIITQLYIIYPVS